MSIKEQRMDDNIIKEYSRALKDYYQIVEILENMHDKVFNFVELCVDKELTASKVKYTKNNIEVSDIKRTIFSVRADGYNALIIDKSWNDMERQSFDKLHISIYINSLLLKTYTINLAKNIEKELNKILQIFVKKIKTMEEK